MAFVRYIIRLSHACAEVHIAQIKSYEQYVDEEKVYVDSYE